MRFLIALMMVGLADVAIASEVWLCKHPARERENLTFTVDGVDTVSWRHERLGTMDPLRLVVNSKSLLTMATQRVNIMYSRFFHLDKFSGRMGETTFRSETLRRIEERDANLNWDMVTTVWQCEAQTAASAN